MTLEFVDQLHAMTIMLRLGPDARIETPVQLRDDFTSYLNATLQIYERPMPSDVEDDAMGYAAQ